MLQGAANVVIMRAPSSMNRGSVLGLLAFGQCLISSGAISRDRQHRCCAVADLNARAGQAGLERVAGEVGSWVIVSLLTRGDIAARGVIVGAKGYRDNSTTTGLHERRHGDLALMAE